MALSSNTLANKLYEKVEAKFTKLPKAAREITRRFLEACAEGIVQFLNENVTIEVTVTINQAGLQTYTQSTTGPTGLPVSTTTATGSPPSPVTLTGTGRFG
jgi:hypothetical protein